MVRTLTQRIIVNGLDISDSEDIQTLASEENGALNHRPRPLGHTTCQLEQSSSVEAIAYI